MRRSIVAAVAILTACGTEVPVEERIARIEGALLPTFVIRGEPVVRASIAQRMEHYHAPGVSVALISGGEIQWAKGYGYADRERDRPVTTETIFQAASISKPVAAMAALKMVEDGLLGLDRNVNEQLTSWQIPDNEFTTEHKVTLRSLLNHSAGTTVWGFPGYERGDAVPSTVGVLEGEGNTDAILVWKEPGESWRYSGGGYTVMQLMMSDIADKPFPELLSELVLDPLGMTSSTYEQPLPEHRLADAASAYDNQGNKIAGDWHVYPESAAAGLWTTPTDVAKFAIEIQQAYHGNGHVLSQEMTQQMLTPGMNDHGLGPAISGDGLRFGHGGANAGFRSQFTAFIQDGEGAVVMTNSDAGSPLANEILYTIAAEYGWLGFAPPERVVATLEPRQYDALTGDYELESGDQVQITLMNGQLLVHAGVWEGPRELLPESETDFFLRLDGTPFHFTWVEGEVTELVAAGGLRARKVR